jgi:dihydropteroate synthase
MDAIGPARWAGLTLDRPRVMGIVNVTPDSFSDGGRFLEPSAAIEAGLAMAAAGADIVDVGGESTRPHATVTNPREECCRVVPVVRALTDAGVVVSVDTRNATTMAAALDAGARIVNDVSALTYDPAAATLVAARSCPVVLMHMRGAPATMHEHARYGDVAAEVTAELAERVTAAERAGIRRNQIALDPGIGFAKRAEHSVELLRRLPQLCALGLPILVGVSRKSLIGHLTRVTVPRDRLPGSLAAALFAIAKGAAIVRVHDVKETIQGLTVWQALGGNTPFT